MEGSRRGAVQLRLDARGLPREEPQQDGPHQRLRKSAAVFSGVSRTSRRTCEYGKHLGLAFQVVDDILDFTQPEEQLGKPQGQIWPQVT